MNDPNIVVLDVRTPAEFITGRLKNAIDIDYRDANFMNNISKLDPSKTYLVYCRSGVRSSHAIDSLKKLGFKNLYDLKGGIINWEKKNLPLDGKSPDKIFQKEYENLINSSSIVLIDFYAPWCGPCLKMKPMFEKLAEKYKGKISIVKINADENKNLAAPFMKEGFPILIGYKNKTVQWKKIGLLEEKEVSELIDQLLL